MNNFHLFEIFTRFVTASSPRAIFHRTRLNNLRQDKLDLTSSNFSSFRFHAKGSSKASVILLLGQSSVKSNR